MGRIATLMTTLVTATIVGIIPCTFGNSVRAIEPVPTTIEFNRDIRPILSDNCFYCHGPDKGHREADLRLDDRDAAVASGVLAPGSPDESEILVRIDSKDSEEVMPPPHSNKKLTDQQKNLLRKWIEQGAKYQKHWAYEPPVKPEVPDGVNGIDYLVQKRLDAIGLKLSAAADRRTLARRVYFDLIGLPPTPARLQKFLTDNSQNAYEKLVDQLLNNAHFGERMAIGWLDLVRFADTIGYHSDNPRNIWPYRDWVIDSFNKNKPFDQFTKEQIAGDLMPDASQETRVGSAFNRLLLTTEEGGAQPKDYRARMLTDRVRAVGTVWLGQTTGCAQCHDHKFDPFTTRNFYQLGAFFADINEADIGRREVGMPVPNSIQKREMEELDFQIAEFQKLLEKARPELDQAQKNWEKQVLADPAALKRLKPKPNDSANQKKQAPQLMDILHKDPEKRSAAENSQLSDYFRNQVTKLYATERDSLNRLLKQKQILDSQIARCLVTTRREEPLTVRVLPRGDWLNESGEVVHPAFPDYLPKPETNIKNIPNRLDLAQWLVSRDNPLTARVFVNRLMAQYFGKGISKVLDDLGTQGEPPVNPELLDWLACEFMESDWDVKHMVRLIVTSKTYRQSSMASAELRSRDPENRELARQTPLRLDAELVRDNALFVAGLLDLTVGGPSIKPYQPVGYWENLNFPVRTYSPDTGPSQYRRGLYIWWQRTFLHPSLLAFDAPSREECTAERTRSNLPQQALVLLNDPTYVEAAVVFAARILDELPSADDRQRISLAFQTALQREPSPSEFNLLEHRLAELRREYEDSPENAQTLISKSQTNISDRSQSKEVAAWTHVARILLNLHETITRE